jgi:hypothetical protein
MSEDFLSESERLAMEADDEFDEVEGAIDDPDELDDGEYDDEPIGSDDAVQPDDDDSGDDSDNKEHTPESSDKKTDAIDTPNEPTPDHSAKLAEIDGKLAKLDELFDDGELTSKEYRDQQNALMAEKRDIEHDELKAKVRQELDAENGKREWMKAQERFFKAEENARFCDDEVLLGALDQQVRKLAVTPEAANLTGDEILARARAVIAKSFGLAEADAPRQDGRPARPKRPKVPVDMGGLPAAGSERPQDGKYSHLNGLTGEALEDAVSRLSPADQEAWARM